jgi:uncharacterized integral membrane protein
VTLVQYIYWLFILLLLVVFVAFTAANHAPVAIDFWPFEYSLTLPFALVVLGSLLSGFLVGAFLMWLRFGAARARARRAEQRAAALEREVVELKRSAAAARSPAGPDRARLAPPDGGLKAISGGH